MRFRRTLIAAVLALAGLTLSSSAGAVPVPMCSGPGDSRCVEAIRQNGAAPVDTYTLIGIRDGAGSAARYLIELQTGGGMYALDPDDVWTLVLNTGGTAPEELVAKGRDLVVNRGMSGGHHTISVAMHPVRMATRDVCNASGCGGPDGVADTIHPGYWRMDVNELDYLADPDDRAAMRNYHFATSADWSSTPPQLDPATNTITADVANAHFESRTPDVRYIGSAEFRLPKPMLTRIYGVDDPDSLTASSFRASSSGSGPDPTTTVVIDSFSVTVQIDGIRFSKRKLSVRGKTWPRVPRNLRAKRKSALTGVIRTDGARPRGSKVRGYKAVCRPRNGSAVRAETTRRNKLPIRVRGLEPGKRYVCTVRAKSKAGLGVRGRVRMPRRP